MSFKLAFLGCDQQWYNAAAENIIATPGIKGVFLQGDTPYVGNSGWRWQGAAAPKDLDLDGADGGDTAANFKTHYDEFWANPGILKLQEAGIPIYVQADDHEWMGDNWDHSITAADSGSSALSSGAASSQAEVDAHWVNGATAWRLSRDTHANNPAHSDGLTNSETPNENVANAITDYPITYWRQAYTDAGVITTDLSEALVQIYSLDCMSYKHAIADKATGEFLGSQQETWLDTQMIAADAAGVTFQPIASSKSWYQTGGGNGDTFNAYTAAKLTVKTNITDASITGVGIVSNDQHRAFVAYHADDVISDMCCGPISQTLNAQGSAGAKELYKTSYDDGDWLHMTYGVLEFTPGAMYGQIMLAGANVELYKYRVLAGSNAAEDA